VTEVPAEVRQALEGTPEVGTLDQVFVFLTAAPDGPIDVCLLSRTEVRTSESSVQVVVASTKAQRNLEACGRATLIAVAGNAGHYLSLELRRAVVAEGATAAELEVVRYLRDDLGVELDPMRFRVEPRLQIEERWDRTASLLQRLSDAELGPELAT
jgi:hypothetical protein